MSGELLYLGFTRSNSPLALRERLRGDAERARSVLGALDGVASERMLLNTCERFEVYTHGAANRDAVLGVLAEQFDLPVVELETYVQVHHGEEAARQLLSVAAGLRSRVIGEPQILSQVRRAYDLALEGNFISANLSALGRAAIHTGRRVRNETSINVSDRSLATAAVDLMERSVGDLGAASVAVWGTGRMARDAGDELWRRGAGRLTIVSRSTERAARLAARYGADFESMHGSTDLLQRCDAVVACTNAEEYLVTPATVLARGGRRLVAVDLGVPRNIDPAVGGVAGVTLTHMDQLMCRTRAGDPRVRAAERIVAEELRRCLEWYRSRMAAPQIARLVRAVHDGEGGTVKQDRRILHRRIMALKAQVGE